MMIHGALVMDADDDLYDVAILLLSTLVKACSYQHYAHPSALNPRDKFDFLIVSQMETLAGLAKYYQQTDSHIPPIIHLIQPQAYETMSYGPEFEGLQLFSIRQTHLNDASGTIQFDSFYQAIHKLRHPERQSE